MDRTTTKALLRKVFDAAVAAAHPASCLPPALPDPPAVGRIIVLAAGKAAGAMSEVAEAHYFGRGFSPQRLEGIAVTRHGYGTVSSNSNDSRRSSLGFHPVSKTKKPFRIHFVVRRAESFTFGYLVKRRAWVYCERNRRATYSSMPFRKPSAPSSRCIMRTISAPFW